MQQRLSRDRRLRHRLDFVRIQKNGARVVSKHFVFLLEARMPSGPSRMGITVSRKVGCAVVRNRAKRLVREAFRHYPTFVPYGIDLVVIVRSALTDMLEQAVLKEWNTVERLISRRAHALIATAGAGTS